MVASLKVKVENQNRSVGKAISDHQCNCGKDSISYVHQYAVTVCPLVGPIGMTTGVIYTHL